MEYATALDDLACANAGGENYAVADDLFRRALTILDRTCGKAHIRYSSCLANLATLRCNMGDFPGADTLLTQALETYRMIFADSDPAYRALLYEVAELYQWMDNHDGVRRVYARILEVLPTSRRG